MSSAFIIMAGVILLGCAMAYAMWRNSTRNKANDKITEEATRMEYKDPYRYEHGGREALEKKIIKH